MIFFSHIKATVPEVDQQALSDPVGQKAMFNSVREVLRQGTQGLIEGHFSLLVRYAPEILEELVPG